MHATQALPRSRLPDRPSRRCDLQVEILSLGGGQTDIQEIRKGMDRFPGRVQRLRVCIGLSCGSRLSWRSMVSLVTHFHFAKGTVEMNDRL